MSRIRNLKPEYFLDEELAQCGRDAQLLFAGLWLLADRCGLLEDRPAMIKAVTFPYYDDITPAVVSTLLDRLAACAFIVRYEKEGKKLIWVRNFEKHQHVHPNEAKSVLPLPSKEDIELSGNLIKCNLISHSFTYTSTDTSTSTGGDALRPTRAAKGRRSSQKTSAPDVFEISESLKEWASKVCPNIRLDEETEKMLDHHRARGDCFRDWDAAWRKWMRNAAEWGLARKNISGNSKSYKPDTIGESPESDDPPCEAAIKKAHELFGGFK